MGSTYAWAMRQAYIRCGEAARGACVRVGAWHEGMAWHGMAWVHGAYVGMARGAVRAWAWHGMRATHEGMACLVVRRTTYARQCTTHAARALVIT